MTSNFFRSLMVMSLIVFASCKDEEPTYGNDGAFLSKVDLVDAEALFSQKDESDFYIYNNSYAFQRETLYKIGSDASLTPAAFMITGNQNGGFDWYSVNDVNDEYFLINFYRRRETYFVQKSTGNALKTVFMEIDDLTNEDRRAYVALQNDDFYFRDVFYNYYRVDEFLFNSTSRTGLTGLAGEPVQWFFDSNENLYYISYGKLVYYKDNESYEVASGLPLNVWNDASGNLRIADSNGKIFRILDGLLASDGDLQLPPTGKFRTFHFPDIGKSYAIFTSFTGPTFLYDLVEKKAKLILDQGNDFFDIRCADTFGQTINMLYVHNTDRKLMKIDISGVTPAATESILPLTEQVREDGLFTISDDLTLLEISENGDLGTYRKFFKYINADGTIMTFGNGNASGNVVRMK
jgi:hypothetical protein